MENIARHVRETVITVLLFLLTALPGRTQQPFATDNTDVVAFHRWHLESNNEFDVLPSSSFPSLRQDTQTVKFSYGAFENCEVGMDFPLIVIFNDHRRGLGDPVGLGDMDFSVKYNFRREQQGSRLPAISASLNIEPATGNSQKHLGSGLTDVYLNTIFQKALSPKNTLRANAGLTFAGNTATGAVVLQRGELSSPAEYRWFANLLPHSTWGLSSMVATRSRKCSGAANSRNRSAEII